MTELQIQQSILLALGQRPDLKLWRINVMAGKMNGGRFVRSAPNGHPDIAGVLEGGRAFYIEVKSAHGRQSPAQKAFQETVEKKGALYILAKSVEDAVTAVEFALYGAVA